MADSETQFRLRIPRREAEFIRDEAKRSLRSINAEIVVTIRERMARQMKTAGEPEAQPAV